MKVKVPSVMELPGSAISDSNAIERKDMIKETLAVSKFVQVLTNMIIIYKFSFS